MQTNPLNTVTNFITQLPNSLFLDGSRIASISDTGPIEFELEGEQQEFLDVAHTLLYVTIPLVKSDGSELDGGTKVGPVNTSF